MKKAKNQKPRKNKLIRLARNIRMVAFDFDGVFTDNRVLTLQDGTEGVFCCRSDGFGTAALNKQGIKMLVISTEVNSVVGARCRKLGLDYIQGCGNKLDALKSQARKLNIALNEIAYLGNDTNDLECLNAVGLPACVADSHPALLKAVKYVTKLPGGRGAVREFCDFILGVKYE